MARWSLAKGRGEGQGRRGLGGVDGGGGLGELMEEEVGMREVDREREGSEIHCRERAVDL